jgi:predicted ATPase
VASSETNGSPAVWRLRRLHVEGFRSIVAETLELEDDLTVLVGRNGAGKTNLLDALAFLSEAVGTGLSAAIESRRGSGRLDFASGMSTSELPPGWTHGLRLEAELVDASGSRPRFRYGFSLGRDRGGAFRVDGEWLAEGEVLVTQVAEGRLVNGSAGSQTVPADRLVLPVLYERPFVELRSIRLFHPQPSLMRAPHPADDSSQLHADGRNVFSVFARLHREDRALADRIVTLLRQVVPQIRSIQPVETAAFVTAEANITTQPGHSTAHSAASLSDGTLRVLALLVAAYGTGAPLVLAIEEPEQFVHPSLAEGLLDAVMASPNLQQVVLSTQSPTLLDVPRIRPEALRLVEYVRGQSRITRLTPEDEADVRARRLSKGDLLVTDSLTGVPDPHPSSLRP